MVNKTIFKSHEQYFITGVTLDVTMAGVAQAVTLSLRGLRYLIKSCAVCNEVSNNGNEAPQQMEAQQMEMRQARPAASQVRAGQTPGIVKVSVVCTDVMCYGMRLLFRDLHKEHSPRFRTELR